MMVMQYRLEQHEKKLEKEILNKIWKILKESQYKETLDSRDLIRINEVIDNIVNKITSQPEFKKGGENYNFRDNVDKLASELKRDIKLLDFTIDYFKKNKKEIGREEDTIEFESEVGPSNDEDDLTAFINEARAYLNEDRLTNISHDLPGGITDQGLKTAYDDMVTARGTIGINQITLGDLMFEALGPIIPSQGQEQTVTYRPPGYNPGTSIPGPNKKGGKSYFKRKFGKRN